MLRAHSQEQRGFTRAHEPDPMMKHNALQLKFLSSCIRDQLHLMFRHLIVRFVVNSFNFATILQFPNDSLKIDNRPGRNIDIARRRL